MMIGQRYDFKDGYNATVEQIWNIVKPVDGVLTDLGKKNTRNKMVLLSRLFGVNSQDEKASRRTDQNRFVRLVGDNWCFGALTAGDFLMKTNIMLTVLMSYRNYCGKFVTKDDLDIMCYNKSKEERERIFKEFDNGTCLYDAIEVDKDGKISVNDLFQEAYDKVFHTVKSRIVTWGENADGMATARQRSQWQTTIIGAAILRHRQYLPLMFQDRYGELTYDYNTRQYTGGIFRSLYKLLCFPLLRDGINLQEEVSKEDKNVASTVYGMVGGALGLTIDSMLIGSPFTCIGLLAGATLGVLSRYNKRAVLNSKKLINNKQSQEDYMKSIARKNQLKLIAVELSMYHLFMAPFANALVAYAKEEDDDEDKLAYWIVYNILQSIGVEENEELAYFMAFIARGVQWETNTAYRFEDVFNNVKTPTADLSLVDKVEGVAMQTYKTMFPRTSLLETSLSLFNGDDDGIEAFEYVDRGLYAHSDLREDLFGDSRFTRLEKALFKLIPLHHTYEQIFDSKSKLNYYEKNIIGK